MRVMVKFAFPVEAGNAAIKSGKVATVFQQLMEDLKPEAAYFLADGGERGGFLILDMTQSSQIVEVAERLFHGLNARIELQPVMAAEDLQKGLAAVPDIVRRYG